jgi:hypothetical protein
MTTIALTTRQRSPERSFVSKLRLLPNAPPEARDAHAARSAEDRSPLGLMRDLSPEDGAPVLVAGPNSAQRAAVVDELTQTMSSSTTFEEAGALWEVLAWASASRMVILSGDLDDVPAESLMRMLGHRYPGLPVVSLDAAASCGDVATRATHA